MQYTSVVGFIVQQIARLLHPVIAVLVRCGIFTLAFLLISLTSWFHGFWAGAIIGFYVVGCLAIWGFTYHTKFSVGEIIANMDGRRTGQAPKQKSSPARNPSLPPIATRTRNSRKALK